MGGVMMENIEQIIRILIEIRQELRRMADAAEKQPLLIRAALEQEMGHD